MKRPGVLIEKNKLKAGRSALCARDRAEYPEDFDVTVQQHARRDDDATAFR